MRSVPRVAGALICAVLLAAAGRAQGDAVARASAMVDEGDAQGAVALLDPFLAKNKKSAQGFLLRSSARFMLGDRDGGAQDLDHALQLDARLRQGWLNLGALRLSEEAYDQALDAFLRAQKLDPQALDNDLNLGTTLLLLGRAEDASSHLRDYVAHSGESGEAAFLVAKDYAFAGYQALAVEYLRTAIAHDERLRLGARTDPSFDSVRESPEFQQLLEEDVAQLPSGSYFEQRRFEVPFETADGRLLGAVIDALRHLKVRFDGRVEVSSSWALIWADYRIKVAAIDAKSGMVEVSAPADAFTPANWQRRSQELFEQIAYELAPKLPTLPSRGPGANR